MVEKGTPERSVSINGASPISEAPKSIIFKPIEQLGRLTETELYSYICGPILDAENQVYTEERNTGLHKQACSTGGPHKDITRIRDAFGMPVYKDSSENVRAPETMEALVEISNFRNGVNKDPTRVYSEVADITHNLALLRVLDQSGTLRYEVKQITYQDCIRELADSLNLTVGQLLLLSAVKYTRRLNDGKNPQEEDVLIKKTINELSVPPPTVSNLNRTYRVVIAIDDMLEQRLEDLAPLNGWNLSMPLDDSNHIFK